MKTTIILIVLCAVLLIALVGLIFYLRSVMKQLKYATSSLIKANESLNICIESVINSLSKSVNQTIYEVKDLLKLSKERYNKNSDSIQSKLESSGFTKEENK